MRVLLINPGNPVVTLTETGKWDKLNKYRVWKPLGILTIAHLTPPDWETEVVDENIGPVDYDKLQRPDLVGITAFSSQATRAYKIAAIFKAKGIPVVMGGIHATMCAEEALQHVDSIVTGEAEEQWPEVLKDFENNNLQRVYTGGLVSVEQISPARHDLLKGKYFFGAIQTTRGCPLCCSFCSVTAFNGGKFRHRSIESIIEELRQIKEKLILFVDDNLIGTRRDHIAYSKDLFRAMIREGLTTPWICQTTINFGEDDELLKLAHKAGCIGTFIGFESPTEEGLVAVHKKYNIKRSNKIPELVRRIQKNGINVVGSFIMGIDTDKKGISEITARACDLYELDVANILILTPLPGTKLFTEMEQQNRIIANNYPEDWQFYTLCHPVSEYKNFTWPQLMEEVNNFNNIYYTYNKIFRRIFRMCIRLWRSPRALAVGILANFTYRFNHIRDQRVSEELRPANLVAAATQAAVAATQTVSTQTIATQTAVATDTQTAVAQQEAS